MNHPAWTAEGEAGYAALIAKHHDQAEERFRNALAQASRRSLFDPCVAAGHLDLADVYRSRGDLAEAERHLKQAVTLLERRLGSSHIDVLKASQTLADVYVEQKRYPQAEVLLTRLLSIGERVLGAGHPDLQPMLRLLTLALVAQRRLPDARLWLMRLVAHPDNSGGVAPLDPPLVFRQYADELAAQGRTAEALLLYGYVLELHLREDGEGSEDTIIDHVRIGGLMLAGDDLDAARQHLLHAHSMLEKSPEPHPADLILTLKLLGQVHQRLGDAREAVSWYSRAITILEQNGAAESLDTADLLHRLALMLTAAEQTEAAEAAARRALTIRERELGPAHPEIAAVLKDLAEICRARSRCDEADALLARMQTMLETTPSETSDVMSESGTG